MNTYEKITALIIEAIETGAASPDDWRMPWHSKGKRAAADSHLPYNIVSKRQYRGVNVPTLMIGASTRGYNSNAWGTYKQWQEKGAQVRKGEKAWTAIFWKIDRAATGDKSPTGEDTYRQRMILREYSVFNAEQVSGYNPEPFKPAPVVLAETERNPAVDEFFETLGARMADGNGSAFYSPARDVIGMPPYADFKSSYDYYSTLAHEHIHWTSHKARCDRDLSGGRFGNEAYAAEELVAELGAAFILGALGVTNTPRIDHAQYVASWLRVLKSDPRAIFTASSKAQQAADWMLAHGLPETAQETALEAA